MRNLVRFALTIGAAAALLAACGGSQAPIGAPGAMPQSQASAIATHAELGGSWMKHGVTPSWMRRGSKHENLLYVTESGVKVFTYPQGKIVGDLSGVGGATDGECVDRHGDVFVTDQLYGRLDEFAHGRVGKIAELQTHRVAPISCSIDSTTGNLAAAGSYGKVNVFKDAQGEPEVFTGPKTYWLAFCAYDNHGNLFVTGFNEKNYVPILMELPAGSHKLLDITFETPIKKGLELNGMQWDGKYLAIGVSKTYYYSVARIYRFAISGNRARNMGTVVLGTPAAEFFQFDILGDVIVLPNEYLVSSLVQANILFYKYPAGGKPTEILTKHIGGSPRGVVVSPAQ